uniref:Uncharacterized protein LOC116942217 isoform X1 n=1 Tax=Petromyzon marinus TaxID=7757 RepID=A0AAJ7WTW7_PETMA|nr:uncharacterized protein LOC116942217 isoform X1 [Petromyzon marinus]
MASPRLELSSLPSECPLQRSGSTDSGLDSPTQDDTEGTYDPFASPAADEAEEEEEEEAGEEEDPSCWNIDDLSGWHGEERDMQGFSLPARTSDGSIPPADEQSDHRPEVLQAPSRDARLGVSRVAQTPLSGGPGMLLHAAAACESESWGREARRAPIAFGPDEPDPTTSDVDGNDQESREDADSRLGSPITNSNTDVSHPTQYTFRKYILTSSAALHRYHVIVVHFLNKHFTCFRITAQPALVLFIFPKAIAIGL